MWIWIYFLTFSCKSLKFHTKWYTNLVHPFLRNCVTKSIFQYLKKKLKGLKRKISLENFLLFTFCKYGWRNMVALSKTTKKKNSCKSLKFLTKLFNSVIIHSWEIALQSRIFNIFEKKNQQKKALALKGLINYHSIVWERIKCTIYEYHVYCF